MDRGRQGPASPEGDLVGELVDYAIFALDPVGTIQTWNRGAELLHGYRPEEAIGRNVAMLHPEAEREDGGSLALLSTSKRVGRAEHRGWRLRRDGSRFWGDEVTTARHDPDGAVTGHVRVTRDVTGQHDLGEALHTSEERLRLLVGQVQDYAIFALDTAGLVETWNAGAERMKGYTADEAIGQSFTMFYPPEDQRAGLPLRLLEAAREEGRVEHTGWRVRKDGTRFWGDIVITALHDGDGRLTGYAKVTRDRTDVKLLEEAQDAFYTAFDHDIRSPVTALKGFVDALREASEDQRPYLVLRAEDTADTLMAMVETLVDVASGRTGRPPLAIEDLDLARVARATAETVPSSLGPGRIEVQPGVVMVSADALAMRRVMTNLFVNALKYSEDTTPVTVTFPTSEVGWLRMEVSDAGRGIDPRDVGSILDEFSRGRLARDDGGSGLGLASVRELVEGQGGRVRVSSEVGVGTTVAVELPTVRVADLPAQRGASWSPSGSVRGAAPSDVPSASPPAGQPSG